MDLLNKIKLIFTGEQEKRDKVIKEIIHIEELPSILESKINELTVLKEQLKNEISKKVSCFEVEANKKIMSLEYIDISQRKEYDKIKLIVEENLKIYILYLKRTINNIKDVNGESTEEYINRLFRTLNEFNRISSRPLEKATILIGDELGSTRAMVRLFIQNINQIVADNKFIFEKNNLYNFLSKLLSESKKLTLLDIEMKNNLSKINAILENCMKEQDVLKSKILEIKKEDDFKRDNQEKADYRNKLDYLENDIWNIKRELDLKTLLKKFHHDKKIDQLVRNYVNDFKNAIIEDKELKIIDILEGNDKKYASKLKEVQKTLIYLHPPSPTKVGKEIAFLDEKIKESSAYVFNLENSIKNEIKRKEKLSVKLQKINSDLIEESKLLFN
ncbi:MAG: hypothetical protein AABX96_05250 [Nanoarchaeota archaeon]